jgi:hypothetical protein
MADPEWIKKTAALSLALAAPAGALLIKMWRRKSAFESGDLPASFWLGTLVSFAYVVWVLNVMFELSAGIMVSWPMLGIFLSIVGCGLSFRSSRFRTELVATNSLLVLLSLASIVVPN